MFPVENRRIQLNSTFLVDYNRFRVNDRIFD